jgi:hypothetical protein
MYSAAPLLPAATPRLRTLPDGLVLSALTIIVLWLGLYPAAIVAAIRGAF